MIFDSPKKRNIYTQDGYFSFVASMIMDSLSGGVTIGFSGDNKNLNISCNSGKIIDNMGYYLGTYEKKIPVSISGNVSPNTVDYYINNNPVAFGISKSSSPIDYFFIEPKNIVPSVDFKILGSRPNYSITESIEFNTGDSVLGLELVNNSLPFRIFSGEVTSNTGSVKLSGIPTSPITSGAKFYLIQSGVRDAHLFKINLYTNFGTEKIIVSGSGIVDTPNLLSFNTTIPESINPLNQTSTIFYTSFNNPTGNITVDVSLKLLDGSGEVYRNQLVTGNYSINVSGYIEQVGNLFGSATFTGSGMNALGQYFQSEIYKEESYSNQYATGWAYTPFGSNGDIMGTGIGYVDGYTGLGTGYISGTASGIISGNIGTLAGASGVQFGLTSEMYSLVGEGQTGFRIQPLDLLSGYVPSFDLTGSGVYNRIITGIATKSVYFLYDNKTLYNTWDLQTGINSFYLNSYKNKQYFVGNDLYSGGRITKKLGSFYTYVTYNSIYPSGDVVALTITGVGIDSGIYKIISGVSS